MYNPIYNQLYLVNGYNCNSMISYDFFFLVIVSTFDRNLMI